MNIDDLLAQYNELFVAVGEPSIKSSADLRDLQENRRRYGNPECFHLTIAPRPPVRITWAFNTEYHLGRKVIDRSFYLGLIHSRWFGVFIAGTFAALKLHKRLMGELYKPEVALNFMLPIRQINGSYSWYNLYAAPSAYDDKGNLTRHINSYHRFSPFDQFFPANPKLTVNGLTNPEHLNEIKRKISEAMNTELEQMLTPSNFRTLQAYRTYGEFVAGEWRPMPHEQMGKILGKNRHALNRANVRLLQSAHQMFPAVALFSVSTLATAINAFCGKPTEED